MSSKLDAAHRVLLWRLALGETGGEFLKDLEAKTDTSVRKALVAAGLIEEPKRKIGGKGAALIYLELTDKGWAWCQSNLGEPLGFRGRPSTMAGVVLERLLRLVQDFLASGTQTRSFGQFVQQARRTRLAAANAGEPPVGLPQQIAAACRTLAGGKENVRVRLADLRERLPNIAPDSLDAALLQMETDRTLSLYALDDPREITAADRRAVLRTATGHERHILYFGGQHS